MSSGTLKIPVYPIHVEIQKDDTLKIVSPPERKPSECDKKNSEIEKIKRLLHNLIDRVDALKDK